MTSKTVDSILRLIAIDAALASTDGLHVGEMAERFRVDAKTIRRELDVLRQLVGSTRERTVPSDNQIGRTSRHFYRDRRHRLFSNWAAANIPTST